jgi:hypothetical protein
METTNPLLRELSLPAFDEIRPEHVTPAIQSVLTSSRARVAELEQTPAPTFRNFVEPLEDLAHSLSRVWSPVGHLNGVLNSETLREQYNACLPLLSDYGTDLGQSEKLYRGYKAVLEREGAALDTDQRAVVEHALRDFKLAGVALEGAAKERFKAVMLELSTLAAKFEENVLDATNYFEHHVTDAAELDGVHVQSSAVAAVIAVFRAAQPGLVDHAGHHRPAPGGVERKLGEAGQADALHGAELVGQARVLHAVLGELAPPALLGHAHGLGAGAALALEPVVPEQRVQLVPAPQVRVAQLAGVQELLLPLGRAGRVGGLGVAGLSQPS